VHERQGTDVLAPREWRVHWWDGSLWWRTYSVGGYDGYRTPGGRRLPCSTMETALTQPGRGEEIRRLAARRSPRRSPARWLSGEADAVAWRLDASGYDRAAQALWRVLERAGSRP
jgi:hypothetical protein